MAAEQQNKTLPIGVISSDDCCRLPSRIGPAPLAVRGVLFPTLSMVRFVNQPSAAHPPALNNDIKERQNEQLRQQQYCPMFQPLAFRDLRSVAIANVPKSPIDLSLFTHGLIRPGAFASYARPVENNLEGCRIKQEPQERVTSEGCDRDQCSCGSPECEEGNLTAEAELSEKGSDRAASHHARGLQLSSKECDRESVANSDRASMGSSDNEEDRLAVVDGFSTTSAIDMESNRGPEKSPPPLLSSSALIQESDSDREEDQPVVQAVPEHVHKAWLAPTSLPPPRPVMTSGDADSVGDDRKLFQLLHDLSNDRSQSPVLSDTAQSPAAESMGEDEGAHMGVGGDRDFDDDEMGEKKILRNATDERVVAKLYGSESVSRDKVQLIGQMPVAELNTLMQQANLSEAEASLIRDIRRRSKNKVAARNCRKRKLDTISQLESEVKELHAKRSRLEQERDRVRNEALRYKQCVHALRRFIVKSLRKEAVAALASSSPGEQALTSESANDLLSAVSGSASFSGSQPDLFSGFPSTFDFGSAGVKQAGISLGQLSADTAITPISTTPMDIAQTSSPIDTASALTRYASVSSLATEPSQYATTSVPDLMPFSSSLASVARTPFAAPLVPTEAEALAALLPAQGSFPQATATVGLAPFPWNQPLFF